MNSFSGGFGTTAGRMQHGKIYGVVVAVVTDNVDPTGDYRVKVKFPWLPLGTGTNVAETSTWARISTFGSGSGGAGAFFLPEVESEVLVAFMNGDADAPVILGTLWNGVEKPAYSNLDGQSKTGRYQDNDAKFRGAADAKKNDLRSISTRKKHELLFNDNASKPLVALTSGQKHRVVLVDEGNEPNRIEIYDGKEENYILIDNKNKKITICTTTGDLLLKANEKIRLEAKTIEFESQQATSIKVGSNLDIAVQSNLKAKANGTADIESSGAMTIKGSTVNIN